MEHKFRHRKGPDIIDRLINACFELHICNSQTKAVLATASLDLLPFGLGSNELQDSALPLQPAETADAFKVSVHEQQQATQRNVKATIYSHNQQCYQRLHAYASG